MEHWWVAAVYFVYDLSPITVTIKEHRRNFGHFLTRLCAVLGGTFAVTGILLSNSQLVIRWVYTWIVHKVVYYCTYCSTSELYNAGEFLILSVVDTVGQGLNLVGIGFYSFA
jgi:hypothetical protein